MTLFLVEYSGLCEIEAESALDAEARFEEMGNALMECGTVAYHFPLTEDEYARRADLPAPDAMADPRVVALVEALPDYKVTLHITHNQHKSYYETSKDYLSRDEGYRADAWISREDYEAAISADSIWEIQWYPDTPIGFCTAYGSTLAAALEAAAKEADT